MKQFVLLQFSIFYVTFFAGSVVVSQTFTTKIKSYKFQVQSSPDDQYLPIVYRENVFVDVDYAELRGFSILMSLNEKASRIQDDLEACMSKNEKLVNPKKRLTLA